MLNTMTQNEFLEVFYSALIIDDIKFNSMEPSAREQAELKRILGLIAKRRSEKLRYEEILNNPRTMNDERNGIKTSVKSCAKAIWHLRVTFFG